MSWGQILLGITSFFVIKPFGTWTSPIDARLVASQGPRLSAVSADGDDIYWVEGRPAEGGRGVLVCRRPDGRIEDVTPPPFNVRTRVHEYGGTSYVVADGDVIFSNFADQRLYRIRGAGAAAPLTPEGRWFYADGVIDRRRNRVICVREDHSDPAREPVNTLVSIALDAGENAGEVIASGCDFYSTPRLSARESRLCWLSWNHPQMPWDGTELWVADIAADGTLHGARRVAGGLSESVYQPGWSPDGTLYFASDRDGWWRLYRWDGEDVEPVLHDPPAEAEFGRPQWVFGTATWAWAGHSRMVVVYTRRGHWHLAMLDLAANALRELAPGIEPQYWLTATSTDAIIVGASASMADAVVRVDLANGTPEVLRASSTARIDGQYLSTAETITYPTEGGRDAGAFYYAPRHPDCRAPDGERPPLLVISHGGPTTAAVGTLDLRIQFWTSRGFAVVDVDYGGSSGYGRAYRDRLKGNWGIVDVADVVHAAKYLVLQGKADPDRLIIRGGSAGGYTTFAALAFQPDVFKAGASYYGVSDLEVLARDTHKFEARYLDSLVGPYPTLRDVYRARSPIHFVDRLACALILFQGLEDTVVPPNQSEMMANAVRAKGLPVAYLTFEGEQHGFRKADTIVRSLEAELFFYGAVFGFTPADSIEPVAIDNL